MQASCAPTRLRRRQCQQRSTSIYGQLEAYILNGHAKCAEYTPLCSRSYRPTLRFSGSPRQPNKEALLRRVRCKRLLDCGVAWTSLAQSIPSNELQPS